MPDFVAENLDAVLSEAELIFPANAMEEIALLMQVTG
jgi:hypothetical protein